MLGTSEKLNIQNGSNVQNLLVQNVKNGTPIYYVNRPNSMMQNNN
jgi:hypothetical protein